MRPALAALACLFLLAHVPFLPPTFEDIDSVNFALGYGDWIRLLRTNGFEVEDLVELQAPEGAITSYPFVTADWAHRWPSEEVWKARKRG